MAVQPEIAFTAVAAIDFGTARSGYGFAFSAKPDDIICPTDWVGGQGVDLKTLTNILLHKETKEYTHFGYEAREEYHEQCEDGNPDLFFETFKMSLYKDGGIQDTLISADGTEVSSILVFREALAFMKDRVLQKINAAAAAATKLLSRDIMWVVTVPGMWADKSKAVMRQAAEDAGMGTHHNLILALEPEAASLSVRSERKEAELDVGGKYIVADCGGGTVDFACHKICRGGITETHPATGGPWGSTFIDALFVSLLCDIFTEETISNFRTKNPRIWMTFLTAWESTKLRVKDFKRPKRVQIPYPLLQYLGGEAGVTAKCRKYMKSRKAKQLDQSIGFSEALKLDGNTLHSLFMPLIRKVSEKIVELMAANDVKDSTHLFIVGGFAESKILQSYLEEQHPTLICVTPFRPGLSVIKGSVMFGLQPDIITSRISRLTYGIKIHRKFIEGVHPPSKKKIFRDGRVRCRDIFRVFVCKGQSVGIDETVCSPAHPSSNNQTQIHIEIFTSTNLDPVYVTDDDCQKIGEVRLMNISRGKRRDNSVDIDMKFGGTVIRVTATLRSDGRACDTTLDYL